MNSNYTNNFIRILLIIIHIQFIFVYHSSTYIILQFINCIASCSAIYMTRSLLVTSAYNLDNSNISRIDIVINTVILTTTVYILIWLLLI